MKPTICPACQSEDLAYAPLRDCVMLSLLKTLRLHGAVCLACGVVTPYLNKHDLDKARVWNREGGKSVADCEEL
jgi:hypothetical protein